MRDPSSLRATIGSMDFGSSLRLSTLRKKHRTQALTGVDVDVRVVDVYESSELF